MCKVINPVDNVRVKRGPARFLHRRFMGRPGMSLATRNARARMGYGVGGLAASAPARLRPRRWQIGEG